MVDTTHICPCGCGKRIERAKLACPSGWFRLPAQLRASISDAYRHRRDPGGVARHGELIGEAIRWYRKNPVPNQ